MNELSFLYQLSNISSAVSSANDRESKLNILTYKLSLFINNLTVQIYILYLISDEV